LIYLFYEFGISRDGYGGGQEILLQILRVLETRKIDFRVFTVRQINEIAVDKSIRKKIIYVRNSKNPLVVCLRIAKEFIKNIFNSKKPDKAIVFTSEALLIALLCKALRIRCISYIAAPKIPEIKFQKGVLKIIKNNIQLILFLIGAKICSKNYSISKEIKKQCIDSIFAFKNSQINVAYPGIDPVYKKRILPNFNSKNLLYLGRICTRQKSTDLILKSLKLVKKRWDIFRIIGSGNHDELGKVKKLLLNRALKTKVKLTPTYDKKKIIKIASDTSTAIMTSSYESFQIASYEIVNQVNSVIISNVADHKILMPNLGQISYAKLNRYSLSRHITRHISLKGDVEYKYKKNALKKMNGKIDWERLVDALK
jgi:hypothetical protein